MNSAYMKMKRNTDEADLAGVPLTRIDSQIDSEDQSKVIISTQKTQSTENKTMSAINKNWLPIAVGLAVLTILLSVVVSYSVAGGGGSSTSSAVTITQEDIDRIVSEKLSAMKIENEREKKALKAEVDRLNQNLRDMAGLKSDVDNLNQKIKKVDKSDIRSREVKEGLDDLNAKFNIEIETRNEARENIKNIQSQMNEQNLLSNRRHKENKETFRRLESIVVETSNEVKKSKNNHQEYSITMQKLMRDLVTSINSNATTDAGFLKDQNVTDSAAQILDVVDNIETCFNPKVLNITGCKSSSYADSDHTCQKAIDGVLAPREAWSSWWSQGKKGDWIEVFFDEPVNVKEIRLLQKFAEVEAVKKIKLVLDDFSSDEELKALNSLSWSVIRLKSSKKTKKVRVIIEEAVSMVNNGFKEVRISGCKF